MAIKSFLSEGGFSVGSVGSAPIEVIDSSGNITAVGLTVSGNLVVNGSTTTINSTTTTLDDPIFTLGGDTVPTSDDNKDRGIEFRWHDGSLAKVGFFGFDDSTGKFVFIPNATNTSEVFSGTKGTIDANLEWADVLSKPSPVVTVTLTGDVTGTANATLTSLGNGTITVATTIAADSIALGTDTTGNYVASITNGSYITGGNGGSEGAALTLAVDATSANTASKVVARDASGNFSAGTITAANGVIASGQTANSWLFEARGTAVTGGFAQYGNNVKSTQYWSYANTVSVGNSYSATPGADGDLIASGKIGIGTSSPGGKLEVNFTAATAATAVILRTSDSGANGAIRWQNSGGTNQAGIGSNFNVSDVGALEFLNGTTTNVIFRSSGSVGIGTTAPQTRLHAYTSTADGTGAGRTTALNVLTLESENTADLEYNGFGQGLVFRGSTYNNSTQRTLGRIVHKINDDSVSTTRGTSIHFETSDNATNTNAPTEKMVINYAGNVGIGKSNPQQKLHLAGTNARIAISNDSDNNWAEIGNDGASGQNTLEFFTGSSSVPAMSITHGNSVGVGITAPSAKLHVSEASGVGNFAALKLTNTVTSVNANVDIIMEAGGQVGARIRAIAPGASHNDLAMYVTNSGTLQATPAIFIQGSTNRVGINRSDPSNTLDVNGSVRTTDWYYVENSGNGMYNNANAMWWASHGSGSYSLSSNTTFSGIKLFSGGSQNTFRGHFYGDSAGQGFLDSSGNWALQLDSSKRLQVYSGVYSIENGTIRVFNPGGATYSDGPALTGAFKIKLPTATYNSNTMMTLVVDIYNYDTGKSLRFRVGGYNYQTGDWYNTFAEQTSDLGVAAYNVRFGSDGTSNCIWIGETNSSWSYPKVYVSQFLGGHSTATAAWASGWTITRVTAFDTVVATRNASVTVNSNNIGAYGVNYITGTANQVLVNGGSGANVTGGVTLTLPQNIHTAATPTFGGGTLNGTLTVVKSNGGNVNGSANAAIYLSQDESSIQGPGTNTVIRMGGNLVLGANSTWIAATNGTTAITINNSQNTTLAGNLTVSGTALLHRNATPLLSVSNYDFSGDYAGASTVGALIGSNSTNASLRIAVLATDTTSDPFVNFLTAGATNWSVGVDNSDSDSFKIANTTGVGSNEKFTLTTAGNLTLAGTLTTGGNIIASSYDVSANTVTAGGTYTTRITGDGSGAYINFGTGGNSGLGKIGRFGSLMQFDSDTPFSFKISSSEKFRIDTSGNVGILNTAPSEALEVGTNAAGKNVKINSTLGSELIPALTAGNWSGTNWSATGTTITHTTGTTGSISPVSALAITAGKVYKVVMTLSAGGTSYINFSLGGKTYKFTSAATQTWHVYAINTNSFSIFNYSSGDATTTITSISIKEVVATTGTLSVDGPVTFNSTLAINNLGIGTPSTWTLGAPLEVIDYGGNAIRLTRQGVPTQYLALHTGDGGAYTIGAYAFGNDKPFIISTDATVQGIQFATGLTPTRKAEVAGDGTFYARNLYDIESTSYFVDPGATGTAATLAGSVNIDGGINFLRGSGDYSNYIKANDYVDGGYTGSTSKYWIELGAKGGTHIVLNTDGSATAAENAYDHFTIWQYTNGSGAIAAGARKFWITNTGRVNFIDSTWHKSSDGIERIHFGSSGSTFYKGGGSGSIHVFRNSSDVDILTLSNAKDAILSGNLAVNGTGKQTLGQSVNATVYAGNTSTTDQAIILSNTRRANYGDVMIAKNLEGVASTDSYATPATSAATGYAAVEMRYGGVVRVYGNSGATTAAAVVAPNVLAEFTPTAIGLNLNTTVTGNLTVSGNLIINGTTTTVNSTTTTLDDPIITLGGDTAPTVDDNKDRGVEFRWHNGTAAKVGFFGYDDSSGYFTFIPDATNSSEVFSGTKGTIDANLVGNVTGNVSGSAGSVATLTAGTYLTGGSFNGSTNVTFAVDATSANTASKVVARDASGNFSAGTITATLTGNATNVSGVVAIANGGTGVASATSANNAVANWGQLEGHGTYTDLNTVPSSWGFSFVQGNANAPHTGSGQWYRGRFSLGSQYGIGTGSGTYWLEMAMPRSAGNTVGNLYFRTNESGSVGNWYPVSGIITNSLTAGTYLTGGSYNGSAAVTITVDATSANTASKVVARDGSGNFSAGTVTAALSGNATTATTWQTARNFTIGSTARSVNGSADVTWTLADIGAAAASHNHTSLTGVTSIGFAAEASDSASISTTISSTQTFFDFNLTDDNNNDLWRWRFTPSGSTVYNAMTLSPSANGVSDLVVAGTITGTRLISNVATGTAPLTVASTTLVTNLNADLLDGLNSATGNTASTIVARDSSGNFSAGTVTAALSGNATTATTWQTARNISIGGTSKSVNGSVDVTWTTGEIGINNGTLTLAVSGTGLSGSASFTANQSGNSTFTVTSNATSANAVSTIVARDSNGDFNSRNITLTGSLNAVTKSFVIPHPTKEGKKLRYGSLEGPENGVYVRGKLKGSNIIELPDYWTKLVDPESITVQLTPIGSHQKLYVEKIEDNKVYIANENLLAKAINCFYYVLAERCDVEKLEVEIDA